MMRRILALLGLANGLENMTRNDYYDYYDEERASNRYLMDSPICTSVEDCANLEGCNGALFTNSEGTIQISDYKSRFNCRWEIKASPGQHISIIVEEGPFFGIEHNAACGSDGLKIHGQENEELVGFGRLCSSPTSATKPYNGMAAYKTKNGEKIQSKLFRNWLELDSDHLVIGFDTDQNNEGAGFILRWRFDDAGTTTAPVTTTAYPLEPGAEILAAFENDLEEVFTEIIHSDRHELANRHLEQLLGRFQSGISRCPNGDQSNREVRGPDPAVFDPIDIDGIEAEWNRFNSELLDGCELAYMVNNGMDYWNTSWPRRIRRFMDRLRRHMGIDELGLHNV